MISWVDGKNAAPWEVFWSGHQANVTSCPVQNVMAARYHGGVASHARRHPGQKRTARQVYVYEPACKSQRQTDTRGHKGQDTAGQCCRGCGHDRMRLRFWAAATAAAQRFLETVHRESAFYGYGFVISWTLRFLYKFLRLRFLTQPNRRTHSQLWTIRPHWEYAAFNLSATE